MSASILSLLLGIPQEKQAAEMKRKTKLVEKHSDHCPHCDFEFREKCYPRLKRDGKDVEDYAEAYRSGDYDEHCPSCDGIIDQKELSDEEIETTSWGMDSIKEEARKRRETQRRRKATREKQAAMDPKTDEGLVEDMDADDDAKPSEGNRNSDVEPDKEAKCTPLETLLRRARNVTHTHPTEAQARAGNYRHGRLNFKGLEIALENPKGTTRRGKDKDGTEWESLIHADYGYFVGTTASDGDAVDCFIGPDLESEKVFAVDQNKDNGGYDECKVILGCGSEDEARKLYLKHYPKGWATHIRNITESTIAGLKEWLKNGNTKKPFAEKEKKASVLEYLGLEKSSGGSGRVEVAAAMTSAGIPRDVYFFVGDGGKATAYFGDWHPKEVWEATNKIGRKFFSNYEEPDDSEIGSPEWAKGDVIRSKATGLQVLENIPHKCEEVTCKCCGKTWKPCKDLVYSDEDLAKHEPKVKRTVENCKSCEIARQKGMIPAKQANGDMVQELGKAKEHSDAKRYTSKHAILRKLLADAPEEFFVDSDDKAAHPGLTHKPTGFQIHAPRTVTSMARGEKEKQAVVEQDETTGKWILWTKDKKRKLGTHDKPEDAYKQEYAIQKSMEKQASPAWAKLLAAGKLSGKAEATLAGFLGNTTRQIGKSPLGRGMEGAVYKGFTGGGVGNSAIKTFFDNPRSYIPKPDGFFGNEIMAGPWSLTGGGSGIKSFLGKGSLGLRASLMKSFPSIFPTIHGTHARGYVAELLEKIPSRPLFDDPRHWLHQLRNIKKDMANVPAYMREKMRGDYLASRAEEYKRLSERLRKALSGRHAPPNPEELLYPTIVSSGGKPGANTLLPFKGKTVGITDFIPEQGHNVMLTRQGRAVISDPIIAKVVPPGTPKYLPRLPADRVWEKSSASPSKGCLMLSLPEGVAKRMQDWSKANIPNDELAGDGRETEAHVTALYGFDNDTKLEDLDLDIRPIEMKFGKIQRFKADDNRPDSDVLVIEVISTELKELNARLKKEHDVTSTYKTFNPHATIAYVKPGALPKLDGLDTFEGDTFNSNTLVYSRTVGGTREKKTMQLKDSKKEDAQAQLKAASIERAKAQARLDFHMKRASDAGFGGGSLPQIPHSTPSVKSPGAWESAGGLQGIGRSAVAPVAGAANSMADTWKNWGGASGIQKSVARFGGENALALGGGLTGGVLALGSHGANAAADAWANKDNYWNTLMTGSDQGVKRKTLDTPVENIATKDMRLWGEDSGGFLGNYWKYNPATEFVRGAGTTVANNITIPILNAFGSRSVQNQRYRRDGTPIV